MTPRRLAYLATAILGILVACGTRPDIAAPDAGDASATTTPTDSGGISPDANGTANNPDAGTAVPLDPGALSCVSAVPLRTQSVDKIDLLFMIDAIANGGETLGMTAEGQAVEQSTQGLDWATQARPMWAAASQQFAAGASGPVDVFISPLAKPSSIWTTDEFGELVRSPNVTGIYFHLAW